ncbi:DUF6961 family protein [Sphingobium yanoikuyae]|uniref:DUF6961 family protein n=1 Tax=Sphingobium yanoikuyae TaxID=13690 RepID=UPI000262C139|nr:hypothetical protein [Sphingobium yanoikuyae]
MTTEKERSAEALVVDRQHGDKAFDFIARRVQELALRGDEAGIARWLAIAGHLDALTASGTIQ